jgi:hypothetical protein
MTGEFMKKAPDVENRLFQSGTLPWKRRREPLV